MSCTSLMPANRVETTEARIPIAIGTQSFTDFIKPDNNRHPHLKEWLVAKKGQLKSGSKIEIFKSATL